MVDFIDSTENVFFHPKGERFFKSHIFSRKKSLEHSIYEVYWGEGYYTPQEIVDLLKGINYTQYEIPLSSYFSNCQHTKALQAEYNKEKDCVRRKTTVLIRTKSGDTLFAIFDNDKEAENIIRQFNSLDSE
jgi:hypothetical protein